MSIIYDALKKIDNVVVKKPEKNLSKKKNISLYLLSICLGFVLAYFLLNLFTKFTLKNESLGILLEKKLMKKEKEFALPTYIENNNETVKVLSEQTSLPNLVINGIFFSQDASYCLINNQIMKEGDVIEEATLERITPEAVILKYKNSTLTLFPNR